MTKFAFVFPGQGSQSLGMMNGFIDNPMVKMVFERAQQVLNVDFLEMLNADDPSAINQTINTQPLLLCAGYANFLAWREESATDKLTNVIPSVVAGHSLGEYTALVANGMLDFVDGLKLVRRRAQLMQDAVPEGEGAMAAIVGLKDELVIELCNEVSSSENLGVVEAVNFNAPGQVVVAGHIVAVTKACDLLKAKGAKLAKMLPVSVPAHSSLMKPAAEKLAVELNNIEFRPSNVSIIQNYNAQITNDIDQIKKGLVKQLYSPVLWTQSISALAKDDVNILVECGPGKVLTGLNKRINPAAQLFNLHNLADIHTLQQILK